MDAWSTSPSTHPMHRRLAPGRVPPRRATSRGATGPDRARRTPRASSRTNPTTSAMRLQAALDELGDVGRRRPATRRRVATCSTGRCSSTIRTSCCAGAGKHDDHASSSRGRWPRACTRTPSGRGPADRSSSPRASDLPPRWRTDGDECRRRMLTEGWLAGETLATVAPAPRGAEVLVVDDVATRSTPGEMVLLEVTDGPTLDHRMLREMGGDVEGALVVSLGRPRSLSGRSVALARRGHRRGLAAARSRLEQPLRDRRPPRDPGSAPRARTDRARQRRGRPDHREPPARPDHSQREPRIERRVLPGGPRLLGHRRARA